MFDYIPSAGNDGGILWKFAFPESFMMRGKKLSPNLLGLPFHLLPNVGFEPALKTQFLFLDFAMIDDDSFRCMLPVPMN